MSTILITGGAGFIGINFVKYLQKHHATSIIVLDKFTYAANQNEFKSMGVRYAAIDIAYKTKLETFFEKNKIDTVIHFAAESHVDNSIADCMPFVYTNVIGTINLLDMAVKHKVKKFIHISTDEVFGEISKPEKFNENSNINPRNPYSASKASAEHFVHAYSNTYGVQYIMINSSNNYGPYQYPEKLIPVAINSILNGKKVPVYGNGTQIRDWIYVEDTCDIIYRIMNHGKLNTRYCIGGDNEVKNLDLVKMILDKMGLDDSHITFVSDRPGHDIRYSTDISKVKSEFDWSPKWNLSEGLDHTISWIKKHENRV